MPGQEDTPDQTAAARRQKVALERNYKTVAISAVAAASRFTAKKPATKAAPWNSPQMAAAIDGSD